MVRLMDLIDVHNSIDTMKFSSFVDDYMYDDVFYDMCDEAHIGPSDFLEQKIGEALDPIRSLELDDYSKDYSHMVAAKDNCLHKISMMTKLKTLNLILMYSYCYMNS